MTPKEKAEELITKFELTEREEKWQDEIDTPLAKKCAIIAVNEIIKALKDYDDITEADFKEEHEVIFSSFMLQNMDGDFRYWNKVKEELNKI